MTKLFDRTFGTSTEDAVSDMDILEKIGLLQQFVKPHHLDIPKVLHNEASWLDPCPEVSSEVASEEVAVHLRARAQRHNTAEMV
ncbi:Vacuolar protein sorting-associated protein 9A [Zea mays]|uniref:Vacuolar protein sorting-associated protein 9A n=1 Tax=Zea mays TaxID=4577 RepID=A0A1D6P346_MAIZE|nr:Vacuolar protein sorting-associated protein 9A [Zea mays]